MAEFTDIAASTSGQLLRRLAGSGAAPAAATPATPATARPAVAFASDNERNLARIWAELLDIDPTHVTPRDNFFDLGGDSLLAMRAVEAAGRQLGFRIDARRYFYENLAQLANAEAAVTIAPAGAAAVARKEESGGGLLKRMFGFGGKDKASK